MKRRFLLVAAALLALALPLPLAIEPAFAQPLPITFNQRAVINATGTGDQTIVAGVANKRIYVYGFALSTSTVVNWTWKSGATSLSGPVQANAWSQSPVLGSPAFFVTAAGDNLVLNLSASATLGGVVWYAQQ